jgi:hypothetical protein
MTKKGEKRFLEVLAGLGELYGKKVSPALYRIYLDAMEKYGDQEVLEALNRCSVTLRFFPVPADIIEAMGSGEEAKALEAWGALEEATRRVGRYGRVQFEDGKISHVVRLMGGWDAVCQWRINDLDFRRKEFIGAYKASRADSDHTVLAGVLSRGEPLRIGIKTGKPENMALAAPQDSI